MQNELMEQVLDTNIVDFYNKKVRLICSKISFKKHLIAQSPELVSMMEKVWAIHPRLRMRDGIIDAAVMEEIINIVSPEYISIVSEVERIIETPIKKSVYDFDRGEVDVTLYGHIRIVLNSDVDLPKFYVDQKTQAAENTIERRDWVEISASEIEKKAFSLYFRGYDYYYIAWILFALKIWEHFKRGSTCSFIKKNRWTCSGFALKKIKNITTFGFDNPINKLVVNREKGVTEFDELKMAAQIAELFAFIYVWEGGNNKRKSYHRIYEGHNEVNNLVADVFFKPQYRDLAKAWLIGGYHEGNSGARYQLRMKHFKVIKKNKEVFDFWVKDSVCKLIYLSVLEFNEKKGALNEHVDANYFSYDNMIIKNNVGKGIGFKFHSKVAMRRAFGLDSEVFLSILGNHYENTRRKFSQKMFWRFAMLWLEKTKRYPNIESEIIYKLRELYFLDINFEKEVEENIPYIFDLIYEYAEVHRKYNLVGSSVIKAIMEYINGTVIIKDGDGNYIKGKSRNGCLITKDTTVKSLIRKSMKWKKLDELVRKRKLEVRRAKRKAEKEKKLK